MAMAATIAGSDSRSGDAGVTCPFDPWKCARLLSIDTACGPDACWSISIRPRHGSRYATCPWTTWLRFSLVAIETVRRSFRHAASTASMSGAARTMLPPSATKPCTRPSIIAWQPVTVVRPSCRGGSNPYISARASSGTNSGFSVMPTVRWPCTLEWPRIGHTPAPGLPMLPRSSSRFVTMWIACTPATCCVRPMPYRIMHVSTEA